MRSVILALTLCGLLACNNKPADTTQNQAKAETKPLVSGIDVENLSSTIRPQDDFFRYVNGTWLDQTEIPADKTSYGSFVMLLDRSREQLKSIVDELSVNTYAKGTNEQKISDFYKTFLNEDAIQAAGITPLKPEIDRIDAIANQNQLAEYFARTLAIPGNAPFACFVSPDQKDSNRYTVYVSQSGLGLPDRDYYFNEGERFDVIRKEYLNYLAQLLTFAGRDKAEARAKAIYELEKKLAEKQWSRVENRDRDKTYNPMALDAIKQNNPDFAWEAYFTALNADLPAELVVRQPNYLPAMSEIVRKTDISVWRDYLLVGLMDGFAPFLNAEIELANFNFRSKVLSGAEAQQPRWERAIDFMNGSLGQALGQLYVARFFKPEAKQRMEHLVDNLKVAFKERIDQLDWMTPETKAKAQEKLAKFGTKIGYPDKWRDYSNLEIVGDSLVQNIFNVSKYNYEYQKARLGKPVDKSEWFMSPQIVNAYYSPNFNEIVFPAAILQPPFFNMEADDAVNYGGIGGVIGHEISHGFDDQGRKSDGDGNLVDWWQEADATEFKTRAGSLSAQYSGYEPIAGLKVNGDLTLGENIGDLGGLTVALTAYHKSLSGQPAPVMDGFTGDQRVFLGWAQVWRIKYREDALRQRIMTDPHSPGEFRVLGVMPNIDGFYSAFDVKEGDKMYIAPEKRVRIW